MISEYLDTLAGALSFDRSLSERIRREAEDHLRAAVAADPRGDGPEAKRRAIADFGDPHVIATQFAVVSLTNHTRRVGGIVILVIAGVFIAMKARVAWYTIMQCGISEDIRAASGIVGLVDRCSFWLSVVVGIGGWAYIGGRRIPAAFSTGHRKQLRHFFLLCVAAAGALAVSVISDGVLTALRLPEAELSAEFLIPIFSVAVEIACAGALVFQLRSIARRATSTAALFKT